MFIGNQRIGRFATVLSDPPGFDIKQWFPVSNLMGRFTKVRIKFYWINRNGWWSQGWWVIFLDDAEHNNCVVFVGYAIRSAGIITPLTVIAPPSSFAIKDSSYSCQLPLLLLLIELTETNLHHLLHPRAPVTVSTVSLATASHRLLNKTNKHSGLESLSNCGEN